MEILYKIANASVIPFWIMLAFFASSPLTKKLLYNYSVHLVLALVYAVFIIWGTIENAGGAGGIDSLSNLRIAFTNDKVLLAAWLHYLVFDLFVGAWITKKALKEQLPNWIKLPSLFFSLVFGPIGLLLFMALRKVQKQV